MKIIILWIGLLFNFWASFCLVGGPNGTVNSNDSLWFGLSCELIAIVCIVFSTKQISRKWYFYLPIGSTFIAWIVTTINYRYGFSLWSIIMPVATIWAIIYYIVWLSQRDSV